jgi:hypothetical protein
MAKSILALMVTTLLVVTSARIYWRRRSAISGLGLLAATCFLVVAAAHVFEAFDLLPAFGWGRPSSVGHYIDLAAATLGIVLTGGALALMISRRPTSQ